LTTEGALVQDRFPRQHRVHQVVARWWCASRRESVIYGDYLAQKSALCPVNDVLLDPIAQKGRRRGNMLQVRGIRRNGSRSAKQMHCSH
jgi:hypothetical protein